MMPVRTSSDSATIWARWTRLGAGAAMTGLRSATTGGDGMDAPWIFLRIINFLAVLLSMFTGVFFAEDIGRY
jgi:hypothetical protein